MTLINYSYSAVNHNDGTISLDVRFAGLNKDECEALRSKMMKEIDKLQHSRDRQE